MEERKYRCGRNDIKGTEGEMEEVKNRMELENE